MSEREKIIPYSRQLIEQDDIDAVVEVLKSDYLTQGSKVVEFEKALAEYCSAKYAIVFSSGTAALHAAYSSIDLKKGDEIITTPITFAATVNAAVCYGAKPVFVDVEPDLPNIDATLIESKITDKTRAIVPVHYSGHPVNIGKIHEIARAYKIPVIEDACHAIGAKYKDIRIGPLSDMTIFSFHPVKPMTTGEGGAVLTNHEVLYEKMKMVREHGITKDKRFLIHKEEGDWYYEMHEMGFNCRLTDIQSALGISQLKKLDRYIEERREIVKFYHEHLKDVSEIEMPKERNYAYSSWHLFPIMLMGELARKRREIFEELRARKIWVQVHYIPVYWHPYYQMMGFSKGLCRTAENFYKSTISLPVYPGMTSDDAQYVVDTLKNIISKY